MSAASAERTAELAANLSDVQAQIDAARLRAERTDPVTLIAVTKTYPAADVRALADLGVTQVGENRHPEARNKYREVDDARLLWHFIGGVQTNKAGQIARYADVVHSVDRPQLVAALDRGAQAAERRLRCLVQVDFDTTDPGRSGVEAAQVGDLAQLIADSENLDLGGVMTVAPLRSNPAEVFAELAELSTVIRASWPGADWISAGMSHDLDAAVACGATHVRIGRSILGERTSTR
jgi:pyridoxal phosphate enzyme (YggS family)